MWLQKFILTKQKTKFKEGVYKNMKQGLLFKDSPEGNFELYCTMSNGHDRCNTLFETLSEYRKHSVEVHEIDWCITELPVRPKRRFNTNQEELDNIKNRKCWCGKNRGRDNKRSTYNGKYCSEAHFKEWWNKTDNTAFHRRKFLRHAPRICNNCGVKTNYREMDHIIAIVLGGHAWDYRNLQALCEECHKIKTASDIKILSWWKRESKYYDVTFKTESQLLLEAFLIQ